jgi:hypothetical protein
MTLDETPGGGCTFSLTIPCVSNDSFEDAGGAHEVVAAAAEVDSVATAFGNVLCRPAEFGGLPLPEPVR